MIPTHAATDELHGLDSQDTVSREIADLQARDARDRDARDGGIRLPPRGPDPDSPPSYARQPRLDWPPYRSTALRHPTKELHQADPETIERCSPVFGPRDVDPLESDLTVQASGEPIGERIRVQGRVLDGGGRPVRHQLIELWQANAAGRYVHERDRHPAPIDPNFIGTGRCLTDQDGWYSFVTIKPGPYPWRNHLKAWRPAHLHFSVFGTAFTQRLVTQMYFPGDPLLTLDPILQSITDQRDRDLLVATFDHDRAEHEWLLGYRWDIVLTGTHTTWTEPEPEARDAARDT